MKIGMSEKEKLNLNGKIVTIELLHELASDSTIQEINLGDSVSGREIKGCTQHQREFDQWELSYNNGNRILVYV
jgi:hypothetical protein